MQDKKIQRTYFRKRLFFTFDNVHVYFTFVFSLDLTTVGAVKMVLDKFTLKRMVDDLEKYLYNISRTNKVAR